MYTIHLSLIKVEWTSRMYQVVTRNCVVFLADIKCVHCLYLLSLLAFLSFFRCRKRSYYIYLSGSLDQFYLNLAKASISYVQWFPRTIRTWYYVRLVLQIGHTEMLKIKNMISSI